MRFLLLLFSLIAIGSASAATKLNLFIWSEYLPETVITRFEQEFDCDLVVDLYEEAESMFSKIQSGGAGLYDVVVAPDYLVPGFIKLKLAAPLRSENIPNIKHLEPQFTSNPYDPENKYSAAYQWGTVGIYVRRKPGESLDESWSLFFDPKKQPGSFVLIDSMRDLIGAALKYQGHSYNSVNPAELKAARELVLDAKKRSSGFSASVGSSKKVLEKSVRLGIVYSGEGARGMSEDRETYYFIPREGSQIWVDNMLVLSQSKERDLAEKFINFILRPEISAEISNFTQFTTPNKAAKPLIKKELLENPAIYPGPDTLKKLEFLEDLGRNSRLYDQIWTQIKSK